MGLVTSDVQNRTEENNRLGNQKTNVHTSSQRSSGLSIQRWKISAQTLLRIFSIVVMGLFMCCNVDYFAFKPAFSSSFPFSYFQIGFLECDGQSRKSSGVLKWRPFLRLLIVAFPLQNVFIIGCKTPLQSNEIS